jgi:hypothetical protein
VSRRLNLHQGLEGPSPDIVEVREMSIVPDVARLTPDGSRFWVQGSVVDSLELLDGTTTDTSIIGAWESVGPAATSRDGSRAAIVNDDGLVVSIDRVGRASVTQARVDPGETLRDLSPDGALLLIADPSGIKLVEAASGRTVSRIEAPSGSAVALGPLVGQIAVGDGHSIQVRTPRAVGELTLRGSESPAIGIWFDESGRWLTCATAQGLLVWELDLFNVGTAAIGEEPLSSWVAPSRTSAAYREGDLVGLPVLNAPVSAQAISPDGTIVARCDHLQRLWITDLTAPQPIDRRLDLTSQCQDLLFLDNTHIAAIEVTTDSVTTVTLINAGKCTIERSLRLDGPSKCAAVTADGSLLVGVGARVVHLDHALREVAAFEAPDRRVVTSIAPGLPGSAVCAIITDWTELWVLDPRRRNWSPRAIGATQSNPLRRCAWASESELVLGRNSSIAVYDLSESPPSLTFEGDLEALGMRALRLQRIVWPLD